MREEVTIFDFNNLSGGDHTVYIRDANGCESEWNIEFPESVQLDPEVIVENTCFDNMASNQVTVTLDPSVDGTQVTYSLNDGPPQTSNIFTDLPPSNDNYIVVMHSNGCSQTTDFFDIEGYDPIALTLVEGQELNEIVANATGGAGGNQYTLNGEDYGSTNTFIIGETGTYEVTVTDSAGCTATATIFMEFIEICIPNYFTPNNDGVLDTWAPGCADNYPYIKADIYDRYGRMVATIRAGEAWDGRYNNTELPMGDYWFVVTLGQPDTNEFVGHFTLYR
mgnify:CR=1 FL=1